MPFQAVPNVAEVDVRGVLYGQQVESTLYFEKAGGYIMADLNDLAALVRAWWFDNIMPMMTADYTFTEVFARDLSTADGVSATDIAESGSPGLHDSIALPGNAAYAISFRTGLAGRSFRGRNYLTAIPENEVGGNSVSPSYRTAAQAAYGALLDVLSDTDFVWGVVSRVTAGLPREVGIITQIVTAVAVDAFIDSQRRRLTGRGS